MIARTLTLAALAAALGVSACPAEATGPWGLIAANGTQLNGIALQGVALERLRMQEPEEDDLDIDGVANGGLPEKWHVSSTASRCEGRGLERIRDAGVGGGRTRGMLDRGATPEDCPRNGTQLNGIVAAMGHVTSEPSEESDKAQENCG